MNIKYLGQTILIRLYAPMSSAMGDRESCFHKSAEGNDVALISCRRPPLKSTRVFRKIHFIANKPPYSICKLPLGGGRGGGDPPLAHQEHQITWTACVNRCSAALPIPGEYTHVVPM